MRGYSDELYGGTTADLGLYCVGVQWSWEMLLLWVVWSVRREEGFSSLTLDCVGVGAVGSKEYGCIGGVSDGEGRIWYNFRLVLGATERGWKCGWFAGMGNGIHLLRLPWNFWKAKIVDS